MSDLKNKKFNSPWLEFQRPRWSQLNEDLKCDVAIIGGGISGVTTLYYLLTLTDNKVVLVEKDHIASGATGHNAGLAVAFIERAASELIEEFGLAFTEDLIANLQHSWKLFLEVIEKVQAQNNFAKFQELAIGYTSIENLSETISHNDLDIKLGRRKKYFVANDEALQQKISNNLKKHIEFVPHEIILKYLNVSDKGYIAASIPVDPLKIARVNSARLCYQIIRYLQIKFPERFSIYENTEIKKITLANQESICHFENGILHSKTTILCTNGYTDIKIIDEQENNAAILANLITPRLGYIVAYHENRNITSANAYFDDRTIYVDTPYFYQSHNKFDREQGLTMLGGPEFDFHKPNVITQDEILKFSDASLKIFHQFSERALNNFNPQYEYFWCGRMGYTNNGLRLVEQHSRYAQLIFNLGCNGIGIVPAFGAAEKIVTFL